MSTTDALGWTAEEIATRIAEINRYWDLAIAASRRDVQNIEADTTYNANDTEDVAQHNDDIHRANLRLEADIRGKQYNLDLFTSRHVIPLTTAADELTPPPSASAVTSTIPSVPAVLGTMTAMKNLKLPKPPSAPKLSFGIKRPKPPKLPKLPKIPKMPAAPKIKAINSPRLPNAPSTPKVQLPTKMVSPIAALTSAIALSKLSASGLKTAVAGVALSQLRTMIVNNLNKTISNVKSSATKTVEAGATQAQSGLANAATPPAVTNGIDTQRNIQLRVDLTNRVALQQRSL